MLTKEASYHARVRLDWYILTKAAVIRCLLRQHDRIVDAVNTKKVPRRWDFFLSSSRWAAYLLLASTSCTLSTGTISSLKV
jgi:hypothetical protein